MITSTHSGTLARSAALVLALAALAAPVAGGGVDRGLGTPAAQPSASYPDAFERAVARGQSEQAVLRKADGYQPQLRSIPDAFERAVARGPRERTGLVRSVDGYQPQLHIGDGAQPAAGSGFEWSDAGIGAGVTLSLLLLAGAAAPRMRQARTGLHGS